MPNFSRQTEEYRNARRDPYWENVIFYSRMEADPPIDISNEQAIVSLRTSATLDETNFKFGAASIDFDSVGGDDCDMTIPFDEVRNIGDEPFTIEAWVRFDDVNADQIIFSIRTTSEEQFSLRWDRAGTDNWQWYQSSTGGNVAIWYNADDTLANDTWYHIAVVKTTNGTLLIFRDGVRIGSHSNSSMMPDSASGDMHFGNQGDVAPGTPMGGQMDEVRFTRGIARYTENFIPQRSQWAVIADLYGDYKDPYWDHVVLQTDFETKDVFHDQSTRKHVLTAGAGASLNTTDFKFGTTSLGCNDSTTGNVEIPDSPDWDVAGDDFTIECWAWWDTTTGTNSIISIWPSGSNKSFIITWESTAEIRFTYTTNGSTTIPLSGASFTPTTSQWYHIAVCRNGADLRIFIDGVQSGSTGNISTDVIHNSATGVLAIGVEETNSLPLDGSIDGVRFTKGIARYTVDFTPPVQEYPTKGSDRFYHKVTALLPLNEAAGSYTDRAERSEGASNDTGVTTELTAANLLFDDVVADIDATDNGMIIMGDPAWAEVAFVTHMDHDPPIDVSKIGGTITDGGAGATFDTTNNQFGKGCFDFDGSTTGHLSVANDTSMQIGTQDYCLEAWVRKSDTTRGDLLAMGPSAQNQFLWDIRDDQNDLEYFHSTNGTSYVQINQPTWSPVVDQWHFVTVVRTRGWITQYVDGVPLANNMEVNADDLHASTASLFIADRSAGISLQSLHGQVEDVRMTVGHHRYDGNFRVPTRALGSAAVIPTTGEFTAEGWVRWETDPGVADSIIASQWNEAQDERGWQIYLSAGVNLRFSYSTDGAVGTVVNTDESWNPAADTWYHWAITRDSNDDLRMFIDGTQLGTLDNITATFYDSSAIAALGETEDHVTGSTQMYQSNVRFTKGVARYTADFVLPQGPFPTESIDLRDFDGLDTWFDPSTNDTGPGLGGLWDTESADVLKLIDISGVGPIGGAFTHHAENVTASERPTVLQELDANALNGRTTMEFDGSTQLLRIPFNALDDRWEGEDLPVSVAMAVQAVSTPANDTSERFISFSNTANANTQFSIGMGDISGVDRWRITRDDDAGAGPTNVDDVTGADTNPHVLVVVFHGTTVDLWVDGVQEVNGTALDLGTQIIDEITIGAHNRNGTEGEHANIRLGEVAIWDRALSDNEAVLITDYLTAKWIA